jgi:hypothetical protein
LTKIEILKDFLQRRKTGKSVLLFKTQRESRNYNKENWFFKLADHFLKCVVLVENLVVQTNYSISISIYLFDPSTRLMTNILLTVLFNYWNALFV